MEKLSFLSYVTTDFKDFYIQRASNLLIKYELTLQLCDIKPHYT